MNENNWMNEWMNEGLNRWMNSNELGEFFVKNGEVMYI